MLHQLHEFQKALLQPISSWARAASEAFVNASNPASKVPGSERLAASYELLYRLGKNYKKPEFGIRSVMAHGHEVAIHEITKVTKPFCKLIRFKRFSDDVETIKKLKEDPSVLIVAPLSGHCATLLRDTVRTFCKITRSTWFLATHWLYRHEPTEPFAIPLGLLCEFGSRR